MIVQARANSTQPILTSIPPWATPRATWVLAKNGEGSHAQYGRIDSLNDWIKEFGTQQGLVVVDSYAVLVASDRETYVPGLTIDGVHSTPAGYDLTAPWLKT
jgi:hypothetical protein